MSNQFSNEPMLDMYIFESTQLIEQLEQYTLCCEKTNSYNMDTINEIFRIMHTIKGSSAMMLFDHIASLTHSVEDLFFFIREEKPTNINYCDVSELLLEAIDFIKVELEKIKSGSTADGNADELICCIKEFLKTIKEDHHILDTKVAIENTSTKPVKYYISQEKPILNHNKNMFKAIIYFEDGCQMENIRAYTVVHNLKDMVGELHHFPENITDSEDSADKIREEGFQVLFKTDKTYEEINEHLMQTIFLKDIKLDQLNSDEEFPKPRIKKDMVLKENPIVIPTIKEKEFNEKKEQETVHNPTAQSMISVSVSKLDTLMDLVGEMVISEAMVTQNPDLCGLNLENFNKAARQLRKITNELQDAVMSIRMLPLSTTFYKMRRIVRDMSKKLAKEIELKIIGEETEVDKNIIEHISDPLMHLVRNAIDHGIEPANERLKNGKPKEGTVTLEAKNAGNEVHIIIKDNGKGLNKEKILKKAKESHLLDQSKDEMTDKEIYSLILLPGFSTNENVTEFSGRGVGMDVVVKNIESVGGRISVDSIEGIGTTITLKIPLTLAIIDGMNISVGKSRYTIPTNSIIESFRPKASDVIIDPDQNEMIMVRGKCLPILRLYEIYQVKTEITNFHEGIMIMVEDNEKMFCIFVDELLGQQQVVVKTLPNYIKQTKEIKGLAGCTLLGDGGISLIIDVAGLMDKK